MISTKWIIYSFTPEGTAFPFSDPQLKLHEIKLCAEKMSPHIPKASGQYHITLLLLTRSPSSHLGGLRLDNLQWDKGVFMKQHIPAAHYTDYSLQKYEDTQDCRAIWKTTAAWCLSNQEVVSQQQHEAPPPCSPEEREGPHWAWQGEKQGRAQRQAAQFVC